MKNLLSLFIISFLFGSTAFTQGNLQFNQVLTYTSSLSGNCNSCNIASTNYTVPSGKVWKLESATYSSNATGSYTPSFCLFVNGVEVYCSTLGQGNVVYTKSGGAAEALPIWLKSGDVLSWRLRSTWTSGPYPVSIASLFSIIEFNVIPE